MAFRVTVLKTKRDHAKAALDRALSELRPETRITEDKIAAFVRLMGENVRSGPIPFRRAYLRAVIDQVEVDDAEIRIHGRRDVLERLVMGGGISPAGVPSFVRRRRTRQDETGHRDVMSAPIDFELTSRSIWQACFAISVDEMVTRGLISKGL